jgi:putative transposase
MSEGLHLRKTTYRLYPTPKQMAALAELLRSHQQLYNAALEERISAWSRARKSISYIDQCKSLTTLRQELPEWRDAANCSSQQMTLRRLDKAFAAFFRRAKSGQTPGFPRFKSLARFPGFSFKSHGDGWRFTSDEGYRHGSLRLSGVGQIRARGQARQDGEVRASDILHRAGRWYLSLTLAVVPRDRARHADGAMAYDWGVETFLSGVTHAGETLQIDNPRWWQHEKERTIGLQQAVSRKTNKRSNRRKKAVRRLAAARAKLARRRLDWMHQQTATLAGQYALVATEELRLKNMTRSAAGTVEKPGKQVAQRAGLNREILDTAPGLFTSIFRYKVLETGGEWVDAPTRKLKPSQRCPQCWHVAKKPLSQRMHCCEQCGHQESRDMASARVVLRWVLESGQELAYMGIDCSRETPSFAQHRVK